MNSVAAVLSSEVSSLVERLQRRAEWEDFHASNRYVYERLVELAREARAADVTRIGIRVLFGRLRWDYLVRSRSGWHQPELPLYFAPLYGRLIIQRCPDLAHVIDLSS